MLGQQCCDMCLKSFNQSTWFGCVEDRILRNYAFSGAFSLVMGSLPQLSFILSRKIQSRTNQNTEAFMEFRRKVLLGWSGLLESACLNYEVFIRCPNNLSSMSFTKMGFWKIILTNFYFTTRTLIFTGILHLFSSKTSVFLVYRSLLGSKVAL